VDITARGIFGLQFRPQLTPFSDITASSTFGLTGTVSLNSPDNSGLQNSLNQLVQTGLDTSQLLATSCIVRRHQPSANTFFVTGSSSLPDRPGTPSSPSFPTGEVRNIPTGSAAPTTRRPWQLGDPIQEPDGIYQLPNGQLVLSHECR
jgi:large exoprotein involved in heme utilization and adhesion